MRVTRHAVSLLTLIGMLAPGIAAGVPDPTRPPSQEEIRAWRGAGPAGSPDWRLESVLISTERRVAVINGQSVGVGDRVDGAEVVTIEAARVRLRTDNEQIDLSLGRQSNPTTTRQDASR